MPWPRRSRRGFLKLFSGKVPREGTRTYISPEQIRCEPPAPSSDIYSLGITCYELACGRPPFRANSSQELLEKHLSEKPLPLTSHNKRVTPEFNDLVMKMIQKRPADRFSSLDEFLSRFRPVRIFKDDPDPMAGATKVLVTAPTSTVVGSRSDSGRRRVRPIRLMVKDHAPMPSPSEPRLAFEAPIHEMEARLSEMEAQYAKNRTAGDTTKIAEQIRRLRRELAALKREIYSQLDPWQIVQVSRHPAAPRPATIST